MKHTLFLVCSVPLCLCGSSSWQAAPAQRASREILTYPPAKLGPAPNYVTALVAPTATSFVVDDDRGQLFVTHRPPRAKESPPPGAAWPQLTYSKFGPAGLPAPPRNVALPKPAALATRANYPLALAFHPKLPLLYVWQDIEAVTPRTDATDAPVYKEFDHVLVYDLEGPEPQLLLAFGRGEKFAFGQGFAAMTLDPAGTRLFVGNLQHPVKTGVNGAVGYFRLAADGLPELEAEARKPATDRAGRLAAAQSLAAKVPAAKDGGLKRISTEKYGLLWAMPCGLGMYSPSSDVLVFGGPGGPVAWEPNNGRAELQAGFIPPYYRPANIGNLDRMVAHPGLPVLYGSITAPESVPTVTDSFLWRTEHADGFPTLLPQRMILYTFRASTPPVVLPGHDLLAVGGEKRVALVTLDADGRLTKERAEFEVHAARVRGLAYSAKLDRLYVGTDEPQPEKKEPKK